MSSDPLSPNEGREVCSLANNLTPSLLRRRHVPRQASRRFDLRDHRSPLSRPAFRVECAAKLRRRVLQIVRLAALSRFHQQRGGVLPDRFDLPRLRQRLRASASKCIRTCCDTPVAMRWRMRGMIRAPCKATSAIRTFSIRFAIPSLRRRGSKTSGGSVTAPSR